MLNLKLNFVKVTTFCFAMESHQCQNLTRGKSRRTSNFLIDFKYAALSRSPNARSLFLALSLNMGLSLVCSRAYELGP